MQPIPGILLSLAGMIGVVGLVLTVINWNDRRLIHALATVPVLTCADLLTGPLPKRVLVEGRTVPGPDGPLRAPLSGRPCVWSRAEAQAYVHDDEWKNKKGVVWHHEQPSFFQLRDHSATVMVSASLLRREWNEYYLNRLKPSMLGFDKWDPPESPTPASSMVTAPPDKQPCHDSRQLVARLGVRGMAYGRMAQKPDDPFWMTERLLTIGQLVTVLAKPVRVDAGVQLRAASFGPVGAAGYRLAQLRTAADAVVADNLGLHRHFLRAAAWLVGVALVLQLLGWVSS